MNFGQAIELLKEGNKVARSGWNGKGMWLQLCTPTKDDGYVYVNSEGIGKWLPLSTHILLKTVTDEFSPWLPSQADMLAEDWKVVE